MSEPMIQRTVAEIEELRDAAYKLQDRIEAEGFIGISDDVEFIKELVDWLLTPGRPLKTFLSAMDMEFE